MWANMESKDYVYSGRPRVVVGLKTLSIFLQIYDHK